MYHAFLLCINNVVPRQFKGRPTERQQQAKAVGNKEHFIKIYCTYMYVFLIFFKAVALSVSTAARSLPPSHLAFNLDVPPFFL